MMPSMVNILLFSSFVFATVCSLSTNKTITRREEPVGCSCAVFLTSQFERGSKEQPKGTPALAYDHPETVPCTPSRNRLCLNKCLDMIVKFLPNSPTILCASIDHDCYKEKAYLFIKNCKNEWINTNLSAGREYCCKDGATYKCPTN